jgi:Zn-dependent alcohol dehydrogenase
MGQTREGNSIGIWGCGGIGLNTIRFAALRNCNPVVAIDLEMSKRDIALEFGANHFIDSSKDDPTTDRGLMRLPKIGHKGRAFSENI